MRHLVLLIILVALTLACRSQRNRDPQITFVYFDNNNNPTADSIASFMGVIKKLNDTTWEYNYYHRNGPLVSVDTYRDSLRTIPHGYTAKFSTDGLIREKGYMTNGKPSGGWFHLDINNKWVRDTSVLPLREIDNDAGLQGCIEIPPAFNYNGSTWNQYLLSRLTQSEIPPDGGSVIRVCYTIDTIGYTDEIQLESSISYAIDEEVLSIIRRAPKWQPATRNDKPFRFRRIQPLVFCQE